MAEGSVREGGTLKTSSFRTGFACCGGGAQHDGVPTQTQRAEDISLGGVVGVCLSFSYGVFVLNHRDWAPFSFLIIW